MKWLKRLGITLLVLAGLAFVLPFVIPLHLYIPTLQNLASEKLKEPVSIGSLNFSLLPLPSVTVEGIAIGRQQDVKIGSVTVRPDVFSLFSKVKVMRAVEVSGVMVDQALLDRLPAWTKPEPGPKLVLVRRVEAHQVNLALENFKWGPLRAEAQLGEKGLQAVEAGTEDRRLTVGLIPDGEDYDVDIQAKHWPLPVKPAIEFDELVGKGTLTANSLDLPQLDGKLYGGELHANSRLDWREGIRIKGEARTVGVEIGPIVQLLSQSASLSGKLHANGAYSLGAKNAAQLADSLRAGFKFEVRHGVLYNFDLASAVRSLAREGTRGGQTRFNELSGTVNLVGRNTQLRNIKVSSGVLQASGNVDIAANKKLAGTVDVEMKGTSNLVKVPLVVGGTLQDPLLLPNVSALSSAVSRAGEALGNLFK